MARRPPTYAFTLSHRGPGGVGPNWNHRVTSLAGSVEVGWLDGWAVSDIAVASVTVDGLFETIRSLLDAPGDLHMRFDPDLGYLVEVSYADRSATDSDWTDTVGSFVAVAADPAATRTALRAARAAWQRWEPTAYEYTWRRFGATAGPTSGTAWQVDHANGRTSTEPGPSSDGALPADAASVASTFDAAEAALDTGAWVDLTTAPVSGLPMLIAVDPSPSSTGDEYWIRISFRDIAHETAIGALQAAQDRWAAAGLVHFSYTSRYRGDNHPLTYGVTYTGDASALRRSPGTPTPEASAYAAPRIADTFRMIGDVLEQGGRVKATYDPVLGYPIRVEMDPAGDMGALGTITIRDFRVLTR